MDKPETVESQQTAASELSGVLSEPHAVRWAQRDIRRRFETQYSRWHWTSDASFTLCGSPIMLISDGPAMLPETHDDPAKVTCKRCRRLLADNA